MRTKNAVIQLGVIKTSAADLRGRQSVRTTFRLSERSIWALSLLATQLGIKQKSLFDHLMEDAGSLQRIAREFEDFGERQTRVAKTYVISRKTLETLEQISLQYDTPRDALVEFSIERIVPLLLEEQQKHEKRKKLAAEVKQYLADGVALVHEAQKHLEEDDPTLSELLSMVRSVKNSSATIDRIIERCRQIEDF